MSEHLRKTLPSDAQTSSAVELNTTPYPTPATLSAASSEVFSQAALDLPSTQQRRSVNRISGLTSILKFTLESPIFSSGGPTLDSLADTLNINQEEKEWRSTEARQLEVNRRGSPPSLLSDSSFPEKVRARKITKLFNWVKRYSPSVVLENKGTVARDHLSSERTFLAYVQTSLSLTSMGVALVQLFSIAELNFSQAGVSGSMSSVQKFAKPLGVALIMFALMVLMMGLYRFFIVQITLPTSKFPVARVSVAVMAFILSALVVVIFGALVRSAL